MEDHAELQCRASVIGAWLSLEIRGAGTIPLLYMPSYSGRYSAVPLISKNVPNNHSSGTRNSLIHVANLHSLSQ